MPSTIGKRKLFRIKHTILLEGETFLRNKHEIAHFLVEKKTPLNMAILFINVPTKMEMSFIRKDHFDKIYIIMQFFVGSINPNIA